MVDMTTFDESLHPRGQAANSGQFREKRNDAPAGALTAVLPEMTPADVRNADYTIDVLREHITATEGVHDLHVSGTDEDGNVILEWKTHSRYSGDHVFEDRVRVDESGEIVAVESGRGGQWFNQDPHGDELAAYRMKVNEVRLAHAGVYVHGQPNDGGPYGRKFVGGRVDQESRWRDAAQVSKDIRQQIKSATEWGALPSDLAYAVRTNKYAGGQSIDITVEGMSDADQYTERQDGFPHGRSGRAKEITEVLEIIGNQWNTDESDVMTDYFNVTYYCFVRIDDERMAAFRAEQRAIAARKRADKKAKAAA